MKRFRVRWIPVLLSLAATGAILAYWLPAKNPPGTWPLSIDSDSGTHRFAVELALTPEERERGLMFRKSLADHTGMLFVFERPDVWTMWMKNTPLSLDMLFLDPGGIIRRIEHDTVPNSSTLIDSPRNTLYVLELRTGIARRLGIRVGDQVWNLPPPDQSPTSSSQ